jgi:hypothetical protein
MSVLNVDELFINSNLNIPSVTEAQRDAMTKIIGMVIYNSTKGQFEVWTGDPDSEVEADYGVGWISSPGPELYEFSSATFTTGGHTGHTGPSLAQIRSGLSSSGSWKNDSNFLNVSGGKISWAVPKDGSYSIECWGAQGGRSNCYGPNGGQGARMKGTFNLNQGDTLYMIIGQRGGNNCYDCGGGGATYVCTASNGGALIVAGGGGGGSASGMNGPGPFQGHTGTTGGGTAWANGGGPNAGGNGAGGPPGGGGGVTGNGGGPWGGQSFSNGGTGGGNQGRGGFGGGGGGGGTNGAGGGGGYGGGASSRWSFYGAGGGSYNGGTSQNNAGNVQQNDGKIIIMYTGN